MTLRTPRRRISPRTKRRYQAIREFFRRALGSSSQPDIKISSSIAVNVTDLKRKIIGIEQRIDEVNKYCQDIAYLDCSRRESESDVQLETKRDINTIKELTEESSNKKLSGIETKLIYKSTDCNYGKSEESEYLSQTHDFIDVKKTQDMIDDYERHVSKFKNKKSKLNRITDYGSKLHKYRTRSVYENFGSTHSTSSFRSLTNPRVNETEAGNSGYHRDRKHPKQDYKEEIPPHQHRNRKHKEHIKPNKTDHINEMYEQKPNKIRKHQHNCRELDQDFIGDIIRRQYKPVKMFGKKESDVSQFSAPVCRDQEFSIRDDIQEGTELCSCCYDVNKHRTRRDLSEMRSICDTHLYSSKKHARGKHRRMHIDVYNDSNLYDLIPVKEKSSPKTRRKFNDENMIPYEYYREVPPSPRTLRPRLNLKAQFNSEFEDYMVHVKHPRRKSSLHRQRRKRDQFASDITSEPIPSFIVEHPRRTHKHIKCQVEKQETTNMSRLQYPNYMECQQANVTVDATLNKTLEPEINVDKTDKALCEIKDILQNFLHEIKKETIALQCDKSEGSSKTDDKGINIINENCAKSKGHVMSNSKHSFNNYNAGPYNAPPFMSPFTNPCCYPIMPVCPMNMNYPVSMQNGFVIPSQSYTCTNCANAAKDPAQNEHCCNAKNINTSGACQTETCHTETCYTENCHTETEELIKEIYKFVARSPVRRKDYESSCDRREPRKVDAKILTSRSVGGSSRMSKHDAQVGTPPLKCYSKSCEAIGSRLIGSDLFASGTNTSYSDTRLEKLSLEVSHSTSETEDTTTTEDKIKQNKFSKVLRSIGLFKKKKKDVIEEVSESESAIDVDTNQKSPYRQEITNYIMHGQEYYHEPPIPPHYQRPNEYQPEYHPPYNPRVPPYQPHPPINDDYTPRGYHPRLHEQSASPYHSRHRPTAPPYTYDNHYTQMQQPQVPLCLKEIEVKSTGTQSERKMSIFRKIKKRMQPPPMTPAGDFDYDQKNCSTQTQTQTAPNKPVTKPLFNWKSLQEKAMQDLKKDQNKNYLDPMKYSLKASKELAEGDMKIRNAVLKKLFYKRNPFSPRNLIVKTLLGKDKSSYGEPPTMFRPRMFF